MILDDKELDIIKYSVVCTFCKNLRTGQTCRAYPKKIPEAIWSGDNKHTEPFPGDHGIRFEPVKGSK